VVVFTTTMDQVPEASGTRANQNRVARAKRRSDVGMGLRKGRLCPTRGEPALHLGTGFG
jgi:hypothetical protein